MNDPRPIIAELSAVVVALGQGEREGAPLVLTAPDGDLPTRVFDPDQHRTLELSLRDWVSAETGLTLGYVEQLYTFGDRVGRPGDGESAPHRISIGYLAIAREEGAAAERGLWQRWSRFFPWEDRRAGSEPVREAIAGRLAELGRGQPAIRDRAQLSFGLGGAEWRDELVLERYELLYELALVPEAWRDRGGATPEALPAFGTMLPLDHRRILATGIGRLRAKLKYRPVLFGLMPPTFTLTDLQRAAEAVSGQQLHQQNFRRMVGQSGLVEPTGGVSRRRGGRPATEYRFAAGADWEMRVNPVRFGGARQG
ncbi:MAG: NAD regulator [Pseudomonadota bacterium]